RRVPLALKIAPDLDDEGIDAICAALLRFGIDAVIATNTTLSRDAVKGLANAEETGGLSGAPVREASTRVVRALAARLKGQIPIIGVGGISSAADAQEKMDSGASLVQIYSGLIYQGPALIPEVLRDLR
ncbi:MAG TPA: quinone-dependent dihydroorotate dehydrogenase, partial [Burkholderiales bacterium]|nr:quinone-dependent dihydroorotate dehydrogenase [Burkholderiales bacterium]